MGTTGESRQSPARNWAVTSRRSRLKLPWCDTAFFSAAFLIIRSPPPRTVYLGGSYLQQLAYFLARFSPGNGRVAAGCNAVPMRTTTKFFPLVGLSAYRRARSLLDSHLSYESRPISYPPACIRCFLGRQ